MNIEMKLHDHPFNMIKCGIKKVEMRLFDEKRRDIAVGDIIDFVNRTSGEHLTARVTGLKVFPDFSSLYAEYDKSLIGYQEDEIASPDDMLEYYKKEDIAKYGTLAIEIELVNN